MNDEPILLIDNSNSRTKFCLYECGELSDELRVLPTAEINPLRLGEVLSDWCYKSAFVCSVVPETAAVLASALDCPVRFLGVPDAAPFVDFSLYPGVRTLGADRIANIVALADKGILPAVAIDLGTAITFDVLALNNRGMPTFIGGVIAPGFSSVREALNAKTALLPEMSHTGTFPTLGLNTEQAIQAGVGMTCRGQVREILESISELFSEKLYVVAVGGDAQWIHNQLKTIDEVDALLTFKGMARMLQSES